MKEKVTISMDINKTELLKMLSAYFTESLGKPVDVKVNVTKELRGYGYGEHYEADLEFYFENEYSVGPAKVKITTTLSEEDIKVALENIIGKLNYNIESIDYKTGTRYESYSYDDRDTYEVAYFDGVKLNLKQKGIKKVLEEK